MVNCWKTKHVYTCNTDADLALLAEYEKKLIDEQTEHKKKLDSYFKMGVFLKDSEVKNEIVMGDEKEDGFIKKI